MSVTVFCKGAIVAQGNPEEVVAGLAALPAPECSSDMLVFDDDTGKQVDLDMRVPPAPRTRGRPSLGVRAREVTLLPRHWDWLNLQRGGASAALRRLVDEALARGKSEEECRDAAYRFLSAIAGDLPHFEDAIRELYAGNRVGYDHFTHDWPADIHAHGRKLAWPENAA